MSVFYPPKGSSLPASFLLNSFSSHHRNIYPLVHASHPLVPTLISSQNSPDSKIRCAQLRDLWSHQDHICEPAYSNVCDLKSSHPWCEQIARPCVVFQAFSGVCKEVPDESVAVMRWAVFDLLSINAETYQIIEMAFISVSEFPCSLS